MKKIEIRQLITSNQVDEESYFNIDKVESLLQGQPMTQKLHRHDYYYLLLLEQATGVHEIDLKSYKICAQDFYIIKPGQVHQISLDANSKGYMLHFKKEFFAANYPLIQTILQSVTVTNLYELEKIPFQNIKAKLEAIYLEFTQKPKAYTTAIKANLKLLFIELLRIKEDTQEKEKSYDRERLEKLLQLIETQSTTKKQVKQYAALMHMTPYQLNSMTKKMLGKTCSDVINEYIILEAKRYLLATTNKINQIAHHLGYEDVSYFIRFFKKHTNYSPEDFRKNFN
ncbi:helix-turn-helix domain-containing protein [Aquimarina rhabdastrellae]